MLRRLFYRIKYWIGKKLDPRDPLEKFFDSLGRTDDMECPYAKSCTGECILNSDSQLFCPYDE